MADNDPSDEVSASSTEPLRWPDPSRPIVSERWGTSRPDYYPPPASVGKPYMGSRPRRRRVWPVIMVGALILVLILVAVWFLWWR